MVKALTAPVRLVKGKHGYLWIVDRCPYCSKRHEHSGGALHEEPRRYLGHRDAHCVKPPRAGYILQEKAAIPAPWWAR
jgi:hypothetical protein